MNLLPQISNKAVLESTAAKPGLSRRIEIVAFALVLGVLNLPLLAGSWSHALAFDLNAVASGQWWRVVTHPWVHVSCYHLLLDSTAFLLLYGGLRTERLRARLGCLVASASASLLLSMWAAPELQELSFCGLSAVGHGLAAFSALEMILDSNPAARRTGCVFFWLVVLKSGIESVTGASVFSGLHFGLMGEPISVSHAGGVVGGLAFHLFGASSDTAPGG